MILVLEIEELVPLVKAMMIEEYYEDIDASVVRKPTQSVLDNTSLLLENFFGLDNHPEVSDAANYALEVSGFSTHGIYVKEAIERLINAMYPQGVIVSVEVMNPFGTLCVHFNPRGKRHDRYHPFFGQHR